MYAHIRQNICMYIYVELCISTIFTCHPSFSQCRLSHSSSSPTLNVMRKCVIRNLKPHNVYSLPPSQSLSAYWLAYCSFARSLLVFLPLPPLRILIPTDR